jgi:predicted amino acid-binding ACT domain protein
MEEFLQTLEKAIKNHEEWHRLLRSEQVKKDKVYENVLKSEESSIMNKTVALLAKQGDHRDLARLTSELVTLSAVEVIALEVNLLDVSLQALEKRLTQSGILEKAKDIGDVAKLKENMNKAIKLLEKYYEEKKKAQEEVERSRQNNLPFYVS